MSINVGIIGGAGYTGGELIRLLLNHHNVTIAFIHSRSMAGKLVYTVHQDLFGKTDLKFINEIKKDIDVLFFCLSHGESKKILLENDFTHSIKIIDLANDFRLNHSSEFLNRKFVYGLPEFNHDKIKTANYVANPGCFATCIQLGLLPLAKAGLLNDIYTTGITGSTGAGQRLSETSHFSWRANNIQAYKTLAHPHQHEITESLTQLQSKGKININFIPWRGDFTRGIFISSQLQCNLSISELNDLYDEFYYNHPFTHCTKEPLFLKQVVNTNNCFIQLEKKDNQLVIHSVIDNLLKGASGQAVQNMNLMFGIDEKTGLNLKANYF